MPWMSQVEVLRRTATTGLATLPTTAASEWVMLAKTWWGTKEPPPACEVEGTAGVAGTKTVRQTTTVTKLPLPETGAAVTGEPEEC